MKLISTIPMRYILPVVLLVTFFSCTQAQKKPVVKEPYLLTDDYLSVLRNMDDFTGLQSKPLSEKYGSVKSVKIIYDNRENKVYFINSRTYVYHYSFVSQYLKTYDDLGEFNNTEYGLHKRRRYLLSNLNYFSASGKFVVDFFADDEFPKALYLKYITALKQHLFCKDEVKVIANDYMKTWLDDTDKPLLISEEEIFGSQQFQPLVKGSSIGYLRLFENTTINPEKITAKDIIISSKIPLDLPNISGIITAKFQTPLSHINILTHARNIPNCALKNIFQQPGIREMEGKLVRMEITNDTVMLSEATQSEAEHFWAKKIKDRPVVYLKMDTSLRSLADISTLGVKNIPSVGGKAAHFGELTKVKVGKQPLPLPENAFAIPLWYYFQHLRNNNILPETEALMKNDKVVNDPVLCDEALKKIRKMITASPLDPVLLQSVIAKMKRVKNFTDYRFRSSTNAEDIEGFSGAGLYESKTGSLTDTSKPVEKAIKKVWASLWLPGAFNERRNAKIDESTVGMAILVHRSFGTEAVNGVAVTRDLYRPGYPSFTINAQLGETSVANANDSIPCEQFLIKLSAAIKSDGDIATDYITYSPLNNYKPLMTRTEIKQLSSILLAIKKYFYVIYRKRNSDFDNFAMDVEFKLDKGTRKIYVKQARVY